VCVNLCGGEGIGLCVCVLGGGEFVCMDECVCVHILLTNAPAAHDYVVEAWART